MPIQLNEVVQFRGDQLFDGAVDLEWFLRDPEKCQRAAEAFVFHGPAYHGVSQEEIGISHGHTLLDTANFIRSIVNCCYGFKDEPFNLAIAGYGTGKSHLALTIATLLGSPDSKAAKEVLSHLESADPTIGGEVRATLKEVGGPCLTVALNGMGNFDLAAEFTKQVIHQLHAREINTRAIDELRPRFKHAAGLVNISSEKEMNELVSECNVQTRDELVGKLQDHDEIVYSKVHAFFAEKGIPIKAIGDETVKDVIDTVCREYCGEGNPFRHFIILFDEFGRYVEFATLRSQIAGSGVLQHLFEGVQSNSSRVTFVGFIQYDLNAYVQRIAPEFKNDILRVSTRYQSANKSYLSINLETLIANLLEKLDSARLDLQFDNDEEKKVSEEIEQRLLKWFPISNRHHLWIDKSMFHTVIRKGCWPLSPYSVWFLFHLAAAGKHLQQRSALAFLGDAFRRYTNSEIKDIKSWKLTPVDLWSDDLEEELRSSEEGGNLGTITNSFATVISRYGHQLPNDGIRILKSIVLAAKMGLNAINKDDAVCALAELGGINIPTAHEIILQLESENNIIAWDASSKQFEILGDAVSRTQFLASLNKRVASSYADERAKALLFVRKTSDWSDLLSDQNCDFAEAHEITTQEWRFLSVKSNLELLQTSLVDAAQRWSESIAVDAARGTVVYCYIEQNRDPQSVKTEVLKMLKATAKSCGTNTLPILIVLLLDDGQLGKVLAELAVIDEGFNEQDRAKFGNLIGAHREKSIQIMNSQLDRMIKDRQYIASFAEPIQPQRLGQACYEVFERIYTKPLIFPFDGFSTAKGNAADTCQQLTTDLLRGALDYQAVISKPTKDKNRAVRVLKESWQIFSTKTGAVSRKPSNNVARAIINEWDDQLKDGSNRMVLADAIRKICLPPYGANIASAGLLLGVFLAPRIGDLTIMNNSNPIDISYLLNDGIYRGKYFDLAKLSHVELILAGPGSSEWETLLDEWEQSVYYQERLEFLKRSIDLSSRISIPHSLDFKFDRLKDLAEEALSKIEAKGKREEEAFQKIEKGHSKRDASMISWGGSILKRLQEEMQADTSWKLDDSSELDKDIEFARQATIQCFPQWLPAQALLNDSPAMVGNYQHQMLRVVGSNLKKLGLSSEYEQLEKHVSQVVKNATTFAEANQLVRDVESWISLQSNVGRFIRIAEIRGQRDIAKDFSNKLIGMNKRIALPDINATRSKLSEYMEKLRDLENIISKRAEKLWSSKLNEDTLDQLLTEVKDLELIYEGCASDIEDLRMMRRALQMYQDFYRQMCSEALTIEEFDKLIEQLCNRAIKEFEDAEPPWPPEGTINKFAQEAKRQRVAKGDAWMKGIETAVGNLIGMDVAYANNLREKALAHPSYINDKQKRTLAEHVKNIENHLMNLEIEWLVEKFSNLTLQSRKDFYLRILNIMST